MNSCPFTGALSGLFITSSMWDISGQEPLELADSRPRGSWHQILLGQETGASEGWEYGSFCKAALDPTPSGVGGSPGLLQLKPENT